MGQDSYLLSFSLVLMAEKMCNIGSGVKLNLHVSITVGHSCQYTLTQLMWPKSLVLHRQGWCIRHVGIVVKMSTKDKMDKTLVNISSLSINVEPMIKHRHWSPHSADTLLY